MQLKICVASLFRACRHRPREMSVHILDVGLRDDDWCELVSVWRPLMNGACVLRHPVSGERFRQYRKWKGGVAAYARILLPDLLPDVECCLYADCDTFFVADPAELDDYAQGSCALYGHAIPRDNLERLDVRWLRSKGIDLNPECYICSGFMVMNLGKFRDERLGERCLSFLDEHPDSLTADQCAFNVACEGRIGLLPEGWGAFLDESLRNGYAKCVHFAGVVPWRIPDSWQFYCGENRFFGVWFRFAEEFCGEPGLVRRYQPFFKTIRCRLVALLAYPVLCLIAFSGLCPGRMKSRATALRKRIEFNLPATVARSVF